MHRTAFVTGAGRGIGEAIALALARAGFDVAVADLGVSENLHAVAAEVRDLGCKSVTIAGDIADRSGHARMFDEAEMALGPLTTLVNNAGVSVMARGDLLEVTEESYDRCLNVNTRGSFFLTQCFAKRLLARDRSGGHHSIVNVTSANATAVSITRGEYCISKAGASMASKLFATRLAGDGIGVYEIQPGFIATEMTAPSRASYDKLIDGGLTVIKRFGRPEEVGRIAATLALGLLPYTVGQAILADGGLMHGRY